MSADPIDASCEEEQRSRDLAIRVARSHPEQPAETFTNCKWCGDPSNGAKYCGYGPQSCATEARDYQNIIARTGVIR